MSRLSEIREKPSHRRGNVIADQASPVDSILSRNWFAPALAAGLVILVGSWLATVLNIWIDEAYTIHTTGRSIQFAIDQSRIFELQPPLYFIILAAWRHLNENSIIFARVPSIIFSAAAAAIIVVTARHIAPRISPLMITFVTVINPIIIWSAVEMRVYSLVLLIAATLTLSYLKGFGAEHHSRNAQICYAVAGIIGLYTQFYIGFILVAFGITAVLLDRRSLRQFFIVNLFIGIAFIPFIPIALRQIHDSTGGDVRHVSLLKAFHEIVNADFVYALPHEIGWTNPTKFSGFLLTAILVSAIIFIGKLQITQVARRLLISWLSASVVFSIVFWLVGEAPDVRRHAIAIAPLTLLSVYGIVSMVQHQRRNILLATLCTYLIFAMGSLWWLYRPPLSKTGDWQRVSQLILTNQNTLSVVMFPSNLAIALEHYLPEQGRITPFPFPMPFTANYLSAMKLRDQNQVSLAFKSTELEHRPFWLVTDNSCDPGPQIYDFSCGLLQSYLKKHYTAEQTHIFHGAFATLYTPKK